MCDAKSIWHVPDYKGAFFDRSRVNRLKEPVVGGGGALTAWVTVIRQQSDFTPVSWLILAPALYLTFTFCWRSFLHFVILERSRPKRAKPRRAKRQTSNRNQQALLRTLIRTTCSTIYDPFVISMTFVLFLNCRSNKIIPFKNIFIVKMNWLNNTSFKKNTTLSWQVKQNYESV